MKKFFLLLLIAAVTIAIYSCNGGGGADEFFIPNLANQWASSRPSTFSFNNYDTGVTESSFIGNESYDLTGDFGTFSGSFRNFDVEFIYNSGPENTVRYTGRFVRNSNPLQMVVTGSNGVTLTITKQ